MVIYTTEDMAAEDLAIGDMTEQLEAAQLETIELDTIKLETIQPETNQTTNAAVLEDTILEETTLAHFCEFVDYYTAQSTDPLLTTAACEQQAKTLQLTPHDATPESLWMLIETMLLAIDHLEKKWLDEQIRWEESEQRQCRDLSHQHANVVKRNQAQRQDSHGIRHLFSQGARWVWQRFGWGRHVRSKPVPQPHPSQREVVVW